MNNEELDTCLSVEFATPHQPEHQAARVIQVIKVLMIAKTIRHRRCDSRKKYVFMDLKSFEIIKKLGITSGPFKIIFCLVACLYSFLQLFVSLQSRIFLFVILYKNSSV